MRNTLLFLMLLMLQVSETYASTVYLDFSNGIYNGSNTIYEEGGFTVEASHGFHSVRLATLAWYEGDNIITISSGGNLFDLESLYIVNPAFAGLVFESSKGGLMSVGSITGLLTFNGEKWDGINYFTITTQTHFDMLNQIDHIELWTLDPARIDGVVTTYYSTLQEAYDFSLNHEIIKCMEGVYAEDLYIDDTNNKYVTFQGGYNYGYSAIVGTSSIEGKMVISNGTVVIENLHIQ